MIPVPGSRALGVLSTSYPRHPRDPAGRFVAELCGWLADAGHRVQVLAPRPATSEHRAVRVETLPAGRLLFGSGAPDNLARSLRARVEAPLFTARLALACRRLARRWDAVISHWLLPCGVVAARTTRLPHLAVAHSSDVHLLCRLPAARQLLRALDRPRTRLVLTSESLRDRLLPLALDAGTRRLVQRAAVQRMGTLGPVRSSTRPPDDIPPDTAVVLFIGRLVPVKGLDWLIRALAWLGRPRLLLVVLGDGPERRRLQQMARRLGLASRFVGEVGPAQRDGWLHTADLLALPSVVLPDGRFDAAPVVLLEAMAAGLPVIATRTGGADELIQHDHNGLLVPPATVGSMALALGRLLDDEALRRRLAEAGQRTAGRFTWEVVGQRLRALLLEL